MGLETDIDVLDEQDQTNDAEHGKPDGEQDQQSAKPDGEQGATTEGSAAEADAEEVIITIGDESATDPEDNEEELTRAPQWVRDLRKRKKEVERHNRELERKAKEQEAEIERLKGGKQAAPVLGEKPTLESCDYDGERFEKELTAWHERKRAVEAEESKKREAVEAEQKAWQARQESYGKAKAELKVKDFDDAESVVKTALNVTQQGMILHACENPALVVYALGKNPKKAKELGAITDPVKYAFAVAKLETQLKVTQRKAPPPPDKEVRGSAPISGSVDSELERLRAEADRTGDRSKVSKYLRDKNRRA